MCYGHMRFTILLVAVAAFLPVLAHASSCGDDADALAKKFGITDTLTRDSATSGAASSNALAQTGGVIAPPATGDNANLAPGASSADAMKTAPEIAPQTADGDTVKAGRTASVEGKAAATSQAASLLQAAHHAAASGDEGACRQRLSDARALLEKTPSTSQ